MHGRVTATNAASPDTFTGNGTGQTLAALPGPNPTYPRRWHVFSKWVCTGTFTGGALTYDVQLTDGTYIDSGMPAQSIVGTALSGSYEGILTSPPCQGVRLRMTGFLGGTNCVVSTSLVDQA